MPLGPAEPAVRGEGQSAEGPAQVALLQPLQRPRLLHCSVLIISSTITTGGLPLSVATDDFHKSHTVWRVPLHQVMFQVSWLLGRCPTSRAHRPA